MKSKLSISNDKVLIREVFIGGFTKDELFEKLKEEKIYINDFALKIIDGKCFKISPTRKKLQTVEISVRDLGFSNGATIEEIYQKANEFGFKLCPYELGLHMRLQYIDLNQPIDPPKGHWQNIAIKDPSDEPGFTLGFYLRRREDGFWLRGYRASSDYLWNPNDRFIFVYQE